MSRIYDRFPLRGHQNLRLLKVQPGKHGDPIICGLICVELGRSPSYECLSYEWRPEALPGIVTIWCEDEPLDVTANLHAALDALRHEDSRRVLWADALCINQDDMAEKSKQIPLMTQIYQEALRVIVWLGSSSEATGTAFEIAKVLAVLWAQSEASGVTLGINTNNFELHDRSELDNKAVFDISKAPDWASIPSLSDEWPTEMWQLSMKSASNGSEAFDFDNDAAWITLLDLFANSVFSRAWIVQEVAVARTAQIQCGNLSLSWAAFRCACYATDLLPFQRARFRNGGDNRSGVRTIGAARVLFQYERNILKPATAMILLGQFEATDPRDHIYAANGLVKTDGITGPYGIVVPDYDMKVEEVYLKAATSMIVESQDLSLWGRIAPPSCKKLKMLPTWVPDWSIKSTHASTERRHFDNTRLPDGVFGQLSPEGRRLKVNAHLLDEVSFVAAVDVRSRIPALLPEIIRLFEKAGWELFGHYHGEALQERSSHQDLFSAQHRLFEEHVLNIEAFWIVLCSREFYRPAEAPSRSFYLFLVCWYIKSWQELYPSRDWQLSELCEPRGILVLACFISNWERALAHDGGDDLLAKHLQQIELGEDLFVTKSGYFGRSPKGLAKQGHQVTILGGAFRPYLLERQPQGQYHFVCKAYVEGIMRLEKLAPGLEVTRIVLE
ncbi:hypothetical protein LTR10_023147 [Elasticomyces elasticus]|nr:hypothetical protein LTR10_023147 [Elasticomyces elasticus]KAK5039116.1 hypothetical protein LTR13_003371 [Exophiala sideris]